MRIAAKQFLIEGHREITHAVKAGIQVDIAVVCDTCSRFHLAKGSLELLQNSGYCEELLVSEQVFNRISYMENPEGVLLVANEPKVDLECLPPVQDGMILVVDGVEKPGNLGNMFRTADAVGCQAVLVADPAIDLFNPNVIRASIGTVFRLSKAVSNAPLIREFLQNNRYNLIATSPSASLSYVDFEVPSRCAIVIGAESSGLSSRWLQEAEEIVALPQEGAGDSLNAAMSAAVLLFESYRQQQLRV